MQNGKRLVFVTSGVDILDIFSYELMDGFRRLGYEVFDFQGQKGAESVSALLEFVKRPVTAAFFFNQIGLFASVIQGKNLWESLRIPCVDILMDHPFCYAEDFDRMRPDTIILCPDKNHMRYLQRFYPEFTTVGFLGHGGIVPKEENEIPWKERKTEVLYAGGISRFNAGMVMPDFSKFSFDAKKVGEEALTMLIEEPATTTEEALEKTLLAKGISLSDKELRDVIADLHYVDLFAVSHYRELTVKTLVEAGIPVTLYGYGWEHCDWIDSKNLHFGGRIPAFDIIDKMKDSKLVLNSMPWFKDGTHDRIFNGMLEGCVVATDPSAYLKEEFSDEELLYFELEDIPALPERIGEILSDPDRAITMAEKGKEKALRLHTWQERARELDTDLLSYF